MRHVSRTWRVAVDWLFDRINLDPRTQIKYVDTKNQLADILTQGNFTRDEWNHLLHLWTIANFSMFKRTECYVEKKTGRILMRKFTNDEAQVFEFGDGKTKIYFLGAA